MYKRGRRAEALVIAAVAACFYLYDTGYWLPMGGGSPGPTVPHPDTPVRALVSPVAWRRLPGLTLGLAVPSAVTMIAATVSYPLIGARGTHQWTARIGIANFQHTLPTIFGFGNGWLAISPVLIAFVGARGPCRAIDALASTGRAAKSGPRAARLTGWGVPGRRHRGRLSARSRSGVRSRLLRGYIDHRGQPALVLVAAALREA